MLLSGGKIAVRAATRCIALILAFSFSRYLDVSLAAVIASVENAWAYALVFGAIGVVCDWALRTNRTPWRYASTHGVMVMLWSATVTILIFVVAIFLVNPGASRPRTTLLLTFILDFGMVAALLLARRAFHERTFRAGFSPLLPGRAKPAGPLALLVGSMDGADIFLRHFARDSQPAYRPVGLISPDKSDVGKEIRGLKVVSHVAEAERTLKAFAAESGDRTVIFLDQGVSPGDLDAELLGQLRQRKVRFLAQSRLVSAQSSLREIDLEELLARQPVNLDLEAIRKLVSGRRILVTGAGGSIGSEICRQVSALGCSHLGMLENSEFALFNIDMEIRQSYPTLSCADILCDVRDPARVQSWLFDQRPDVVFHAAALKHVPLMETHPCEGILTNVVGTWNVAEAVKASGATAMIFISTDKAVDPGNVMGATKRLAESVVRVHQKSSSTRFSIVRFGNVLGSAGSVVPTFKRQIERGGPVAVTPAQVGRDFTTIPRAVQTALQTTPPASSFWTWASRSGSSTSPGG